MTELLNQPATTNTTELQPAGPDGWQLASQLSRTHSVSITSGLFQAWNPLLRQAIGDRRPLVVCTPSIDRLYGRQLRQYLDSLPKPAHEVLVLECTESAKAMPAVLDICDRAASAQLNRLDPIVAIGGGVCTDVSGLAAALYRRGIPHIKIPTTLIGLTDAGIGTKNAINHNGRKSALGTFHPPEHSILDFGFLATLPRRHLANGLGEMIKLAVAADARLFGELVGLGVPLVRGELSVTERGLPQVFARAVEVMLAELADNLFETQRYQRKVDFGHTFSPYFEAESDHQVLHGEAVAMDVALSSQISALLGLITDDELAAVLGLIEDVGLPLRWPATDCDALWATLASICEHRNGQLNLVVPTGIGTCDYLGMELITPNLLRAALDRLRSPIRPGTATARSLGR